MIAPDDIVSKGMLVVSVRMALQALRILGGLNEGVLM